MESGEDGTDLYRDRSRLFEDTTRSSYGGSYTQSVNTLIRSQGSQASSYDYDTTRTMNTDHKQSSCTFSMFGDSDCGEPLQPQHIVLDFTPTEEDEIEEVREKCISFWEFFDRSPELQEMMVEPDPSVDENDLESNSDVGSTTPTPTESTEHPLKKEKTALSLLDELTEKGIIPGLLSCKMPGSVCSLGSREYNENDPVTRGIQSMKMKQPCRCIGTCDPKCKKRRRMTSPDVQFLSKTLNDWTLNNPKSMEPPGPVPNLKHAVMQRKLPPIIPPKKTG